MEQIPNKTGDVSISLFGWQKITKKMHAPNGSQILVDEHRHERDRQTFFRVLRQVGCECKLEPIQTADTLTHRVYRVFFPSGDAETLDWNALTDRLPSTIECWRKDRAVYVKFLKQPRLQWATWQILSVFACLGLLLLLICV